MSVEAIPYCIYGFCISVDDFKYMIDLTNYDSIEDWIDDYNRYNWCILDDWNDEVYIGVEVGYDNFAMELPSKLVLFMDNVQEHVDFNRLPKEVKEEGAYFHVFNIWSI